MRHQTQPVDKRLIEQALVMVHDQPQDCPYLDNRQARMPLHWPTRPVDQTMLDAFLESGFRRSGSFLYRTQCDGCQACEPSRVDVREFRLSRSFRRVLKRGDACLAMQINSPSVTPEKIRLLNQHRNDRNLSLSGEPLDEADYRSFLIETCCDTKEISYYLDEQLIAVAIVDLGVNSLSAVYCYFDTSFSHLSLGTYSILKQIEYAADTSRQFLYLGMYVASNPHLNYKARFLPQQRFIAGEWVDFDQ